MEKKYGFETLALHAGQQPDPATGSRAVPIFQTSSYIFKNTEHAANLFALKEFGNIYTRLMNPTWAVLEERVAALEGGIGGVVTASGMSAESLAMLNIAKNGDHIVAAASIYGGTYTLLRYTFADFGIDVTFVDPTDPANFERALRPNTKLFFGEVVGNPKCNVLDISAVADIAHNAGIPLIIDNTATSPYLVRPIEWGADVVIHSMTKFLGGHGTSLGGIIVDSGKFPWDNGKFPMLTDPCPSYHGLRFWDTFGAMSYLLKARVTLLRDLGPSISPFNAFQIIQGVETLPLRMQRHSENGMKVAQFLKAHQAVSWVNYPGLPDHPTHETARKYLKNGYGSILGFGIKGGYEAGRKFIDSVEIFSHLANIGDAKSLVIHPASTTHQQLSREEQLASGVTEDFIRVSVGLETIDDLYDDLNQALNKSQE